MNKNFEELIKKSMDIFWQDYQGFIREEIEKSEGLEAHYHIETILMAFGTGIMGGIFASVVDCPAVLLSIPIVIVPKILWDIVMKDIPHWYINRNAYDIEATPNSYKILRNKKGRIGLCFWEKYASCKLLLNSSFDEIKHGLHYSYILKKNGKYGLYNAEMRRYLTDCIYDDIKEISDKVYLLNRSGTITKINYKGDRVLL